MIAIYAVLILSLIFIISFAYQLVNCLFFLKSKKDTKEKKIENSYKKTILKNKLTIILTRKKIKLQSKIFFAKFLNERKYSILPVKIKFIINDIYSKLQQNTSYYNLYIDYDILKNSGVFNEKPILKINIKDKKSTEEMIFALNIVYKFIDFRTIFFIDNNSVEILQDLIHEKAELDYKIVFYKDINLKILQEINKLDLNFKVLNSNNFFREDFEINEKMNKTKTALNLEEYYSENKDIKIIKFLDFRNDDFDNSKVSYYLNFVNQGIKNKKYKFNLTYRIKNQFFNIKNFKNKLILNYFDKKLNDEFFCFSDNFYKLEIFKVSGDIFIKFYFNILIEKKSERHFCSILRKDFEINKFQVLKLIYENNIKVEKIFNVKIYIKNKDFNNFFNNKLKELIINEKLNQNKLNRFQLTQNMIFILNRIFNFEYKKILCLKSYFELYNLIFRNIFGINIKDNFIFIKPKKEYHKDNFKLILTDKEGVRHGIYIDQKSEFKGLEVGDVIYTNLKTIDLNLIDKDAKLCI